MAYDEHLAQRVQQVLDELQPPQLVGKKMFGGVGFVVQGNMACGVLRNKLVVRVGAERYEETMAKPHAIPFDPTPMKGWVMVVAEGLESDQDLTQWVERGGEFALSLPPK